MPMLDFKCKKCDYQFDDLVANTDDRPACPACGSGETVRLYTGVPQVIFNFPLVKS